MGRHSAETSPEEIYPKIINLVLNYVLEDSLTSTARHLRCIAHQFGTRLRKVLFILTLI